MAAHALGYVGEVTETELATPEFVDFKSGDQVGKTGLNASTTVCSSVRTDSNASSLTGSGGRWDKLGEEPYVPGNDLVTTIDLDLQRAAEDAVGDQMGAVVALDPRTGEILALVSKPAYDPNLFATRISSADYRNLMDDPRKPFQNRAIQSHFAPGSVFKVFMAAAGLEAGTLNPLRNIFCPG